MWVNDFQFQRSTPSKMNGFFAPKNDGKPQVEKESCWGFQGSIFRFHVNFPGCTTKKTTKYPLLDFVTGNMTQRWLPCSTKNLWSFMWQLESPTSSATWTSKIPFKPFFTPQTVVQKEILERIPRGVFFWHPNMSTCITWSYRLNTKVAWKLVWVNLTVVCWLTCEFVAQTPWAEGWWRWNPNGAPCFGWSFRPCFEGFTFKNKDHLGSRKIKQKPAAFFRLPFFVEEYPDLPHSLRKPQHTLGAYPRNP